MTKSVSERDITLIITSYRQLRFLRQTLASVIEQSSPFHQIIVVDDASEDESIPFLQDWADQHDKAQVIFLDSNVGQGRARNAGIAEADGSYVAFLDGDDLLKPNACKKMQSLIEERPPDIALFDMTYVETCGDGVVHTLPRNRLFTKDLYEGIEVPRHMFPPSSEQRSLLTWRHPAAWLKLHRLEFLKEMALLFDGRIYEDVLWHFETLFQARSVSLMTDALVLYRQHDNSVISKVSERHMQIIDQYENIAAFMNTAPVKEPVLIETFRKHRFMHLLFIGVATSRIPKSLIGQYRRRVLALPALTEFEMGEQERDLLSQFEMLA